MSTERPSMEVVEIPVSEVKVGFRLRNPSDVKVDGLAESIKQLGLHSW